MTPISDAMAQRVASVWPDVLAIVASGAPIKEGFDKLGITQSSVYAFRAKYPERDREWRLAHEQSADAFVEQIIELMPKRGIDPADKRVQIDALKWLAGKRNSKMYSDKAQLDINVTKVDLTGIIERAQARLTAHISVTPNSNGALPDPRAQDAQDAEIVPRLEDLL